MRPCCSCSTTAAGFGPGEFRIRLSWTRAAPARTCAKASSCARLPTFCEDPPMSRRAHTVTGTLGFSEPMAVRPKFHANDKSRDVLNVVPRAVPIEDLRGRAPVPSLDVEGFRLYPHRSAVRDFRDRAEVERVHMQEIRELLREISGADELIVAAPGILRFG